MDIDDLIQQLIVLRDEYGNHTRVMVSLTQRYSNMAFDLTEVETTGPVEEHDFPCRNVEDIIERFGRPDEGLWTCHDINARGDEECDNCRTVRRAMNERETVVWLVTSEWAPDGRSPYSPL